ncbi:hypothetical protein D3C80_1798520 [compost metagenome]
MAMEPLPLARAFGPTATESTPLATESTLVELAWKYLMPAPLLMLVMLPSMVVTRPSMLVTWALVSLS